MACAIELVSGRVRLSGAYKSMVLDSGSTTTTVNYFSGEAPASADAGRFICWQKGGVSSTALWEVREIKSATSTIITIDNPFSEAPASGDIVKTSSIMSDITTAQPASGTKSENSYDMVMEYSLQNGAFLTSINENVTWTFIGNVSPVMPCASLTVLQVGRLWGGEGNNSTITTDGSRWRYNQTGTANNSVYTTIGSRIDDGMIVNFYGSLIESNVVGGYLFQRLNGASRFIGCIFDGVVAGRFYHEGTEWAQCRMSGNNSATSAWSLGATFTRPISDVKFFKNDYALKTYSLYSGTIRDTTFELNDIAVSRQGSIDSYLNFIDCTEMISSDFLGTGGNIAQYRSVNISTINEGGGDLEGVAIRVNDEDDSTQGTIQTSDANGITGEIIARRFNTEHGSTSVTSHFPFRIRTRKYGYVWSELSANIADKIKQASVLLSDTNITQDSVTASSHTGITIVDEVTPVTWNGKDFGITITGDLTVNPNLTLDDIIHYLNYHLSQDSTIGGKSSGLLWHDMVPTGTTKTTRSLYSSTLYKGVRIVDENDNAFPDVTSMMSDDGTSYVIPVTYTTKYTNTSLDDGCSILVINTTTDTVLFYNANLSTGLGLTFSMTKDIDYLSGDLIEVRIAKKDGSTYYIELTDFIITNGGDIDIISMSNPVVCSICTAFALDGADPTIDDKFDIDILNDEIDIVIGGPWIMTEAMVWWKYQMTLESPMKDYWGVNEIKEDGSFYNDSDILSVKMDNGTITDAIETSGIRFYRRDGVRPVRSPTSGGGAIDFAYRTPVSIVTVGSGVLASDIVAIADAVWDEPVSEHDIVGSTGEAVNAEGGGGATAEEIRIEIDDNSTKLASILTDTDDLQVNQSNWDTADVSNLDVAVSSRLNSASYVVPDNAGISTISSKVDLIPTNTVLIDDVRLDNLDATVSSRSTFNSSLDEVVTDATSRNASKADVSGLSTFSPSTDIVAHVTLVDTATTLTNSPSGGTTPADVWSYADRGLTENVTTDTASREASKADVSAIDTKTDTLISVTADIKDGVIGDLDMSNDQLIMTRVNGDELKRFNLFNRYGNPTTDEPFKRVGV